MAVAFSAFLLAPAAAEDNLSVDYPVPNREAEQRLVDCLHLKDTPQQLDYLLSIVRIEYRFDPPVILPRDRPAPRRSVKIVRAPLVTVSRMLTTRADSLNAGSILQSIRRFERHDCDIEYSFSNVELNISSLHTIEVHVHGDAIARLCWNWGWLGSGSSELASASGDIDQTYTIQPDWSLSYGPQRVSNTSVHESLGLQLFGLLQGFSAPVLVELKRVVEDSLKKAFEAAVTGHAQNLDFSEYSALVSGVGTLQGYLGIVDENHKRPLQLETVFGSSGILETAAGPQFLLVQSAQISDETSPDPVYEYKKLVGEIQTWRSLSQPSPQWLRVSKGDSLWTLAQGNYPDTRIYLLVEQINRLRKSGIHPGDYIALPRLYEMCSMVERGRLVLPGDTSWNLQRSGKGSVLSPLSRHPGRIYPYELITPHRS